jgi:hypothetical protein
LFHFLVFLFTCGNAHSSIFLDLASHIWQWTSSSTRRTTRPPYRSSQKPKTQPRKNDRGKKHTGDHNSRIFVLLYDKLIDWR